MEEPQWVLDQNESGPLFWRKDSSRVKFRHDVEVKEFHRMEHELDETEWAAVHCQRNANNFTMGMTCILCIAITMVLPWYVFIMDAK